MTTQISAQVFVARGQEDAVGRIERALREGVHESVHADRLIIDDADAPTAQRNDQAYLELMRASAVVSEPTFTVKMQDERGNWSYWEATVEGKPMLGLDHSRKTMVCPSVAIMNRMVMVPAKIHDAFAKPNDFSYLFRPLDIRGVVLVDFEDDDSLRHAVEEVAVQLRAEVVSIARRHMSVTANRRLDADALAEMLQLPNDYLNELRHEIGVMDLWADVAAGRPAACGRMSEVTVVASNRGEESTGKVRVSVRAPTGVMEAPITREIEFEHADSRPEFRIRLTPRTTPFCPLSVVFEREEVGRAPLTCRVPVIVNVEA